MKKNLKKIVLIILLVLIIVAVGIIIANSSSGKKEQKVANTEPTSQRATNNENNKVENTGSETKENNTESKEKLETKIEETSTGTVYKVTDKEIKPDIILKDNYFDTQIADININFDRYEGKTIQIEGMYFQNTPYTFVGRYSLSNLCPTCPTGYSYFEYEWNGDEELKLEEEKDWIKVIGTLRKGNDGVDYYYIDVASIEIMNERGNDTVTN